METGPVPNGGCPAWCAIDHHDEHPDGPAHSSEPSWTPVVRLRDQGPGVPIIVTCDELVTAVVQPIKAQEPWLSLQRSEGQIEAGLSISLESAVRLVRDINRQLRLVAATQLDTPPAFRGPGQ